MYKTDIIVLNNVGGGMSIRVHRLPSAGESVMGFDARLAKDVAKGGNVAMAIARLGLQVALIGKIGNDDAGNRDIKWLKEDHVDVRALLQSNDVSTGQGFCFIDDQGNNMIITGESSSKALTLDEVIEGIDLLSPAKIFIGGFEIRKPLVLEACKIAKSKGMQTILNPSPVPEDGLEPTEFVDYFIVNELEAKLLLGLPINTKQNPQFLCSNLLEKYKPLCVIVTLGEEGAAGMNREKYWRIPACENIKVQDTCGAGDGYLAAVAVNLVWGKDIEKACMWANVYSAYTVTKVDCALSYPTIGELQTFADQHNLKL